MNTASLIALFVGMFFSLLFAVCLPLYLASDHYRTVQSKARARRLKDASMNARLLRFNL